MKSFYTSGQTDEQIIVKYRAHMANFRRCSAEAAGWAAQGKIAEERDALRRAEAEHFIAQKVQQEFGQGISE